jgi:hypothetical protein
LFDAVTQGGRDTGLGSNYIVSLMREEIIHGAMSQVIRKKGLNQSRFYSDLGKSLTDAQRKALNDNYGVVKMYGLKSREYGYGSEYARAVVQQFLYGNDTQSYTEPSSALEKIKSLIKSTQAYITKALKTLAPKNADAAAIIAETADLLLKADPNAKLTNQKTVALSKFLLKQKQANKASGVATSGVDPAVESAPEQASAAPTPVSAETVAESDKPPSQRKGKEEITTVDRYLKTISSLLRSMHPRLALLVDKYYNDIDSKVLGYMTKTKPFFEKINKIKNKKDSKRLTQLIYYSRSLERDPEQGELRTQGS